MRHAAPPPGLLPGAVRGSLGGGGAAGRAEPRLYSPCCMRIQAGAACTREAQWQEEVCVGGWVGGWVCVCVGVGVGVCV